MSNKEATEEYIKEEERRYLGEEIGHNFEEPNQQMAGYESISVELLSGTNYWEWVRAAYYASFVTWDTTPQLPVSKAIELPMMLESEKEMEKRLMFMLNDRPISVALEGAVFTFKITGIPRSMTHQLVRHRQMSFGQQSYRVSSCYSDPVRLPVSLNDEDLRAKYEYAVRTARRVYRELIEAGIPMEQARNIMPMGTCTKIAVTMRLRDMIEYFRGRTGAIAQDEHTYIVCLLAQAMKNNEPEFFKFLVSKVQGLEETMEQYNVR